MKVAIIDKNREFIREVCAMIRAREGWRLAGAAEDGEQGIALIEKEQPDVVLLELILPQKDGFAVLEHFSSSPCKFLALGSVKDENLINRALEAGASYYLIKPCDAQVLKERIEYVFSLPRRANETNAREDALDEKLTDALVRAGVSSALDGFAYVRECIKEISKRAENEKCSMDFLYSKIAPRFGVDETLIERSVRHALCLAKKSGKLENMNEIFGVRVYSRGDKMTNKPFITLWAEMIRCGRLK